MSVDTEVICGRCNAEPATIPMAITYWCAECWSELQTRTILPEGFDGVGREITPRPDWGPQYRDLECSECAATWVGPLLEPCPYCAGLFERSVAEQKTLVLRPDLPDVGNPRRTTAERAWAERLAVAVQAGTVTEREARYALDRLVMPNAA